MSAAPQRNKPPFSLMMQVDCAICGPSAKEDELYPANFSADDLNEELFSARRSPDGIHLRIVKCRECQLLRSDPAPQAKLLDKLYRNSHFSYSDEEASLKATYGKALKRCNRWIQEKDFLLEVGCGSGFLLEEALSLGYRNVLGLELSQEAISHADPEIANRVKPVDLLALQKEEGSIDCICMFQVFDHLPNPVEILDRCYSLLKPGGMLLLFNHNTKSFSARFLGEKSPIIDIEHTFLYCPETSRQIVSRAGFKVLETKTAINRYSFSYFLHLLPVKGTARQLADSLGKSQLGGLPLWLPLGNMCTYAQKPLT